MTQPTTRPTPQPQTTALPITPAEMATNRDALAALMQEPPVPPPAKMTTTAAVAELAPEIRAALKAGHTLAEIAKRLRFGTRTLSAQQLQRYLARCEKRAVKKTASRKAVPPSADVAAPTAPSSSPSREAQGTTPVTMRDAPRPQAPTVAQPTPPTAVPPATTTGDATASVTPGASVTAGASPGPTTTGQHHRPPAPTLPSASTSTKPQSTASPELPGLSFEAAQRRSIDQLFGPKKTEATVDRPRPPHMTWELNGQPKPSSGDGVKTEPPLGSTTRP